MDYKKTGIRIIAEFSRVLIGSVFIFSGFVKAIDPVGFMIKIDEYFGAFGLESLQFFSGMISFNLLSIEFMLGVCVLLGVYRRYSTFFVLVFMAFMTPLTLYLALFDPVSDCGCFGDAVVITNWETFGKNIFLLAVAVFLFVYNQRVKPFFTYKAYWFVALYAYCICMLFAYRNYSHLPMMDFRPYKVGASIPELMSVPEGAEEDEYRYSFVYEKEGVKKEFALDDYPSDDPSWTFVESKTELIRPGYVPPITGFVLFNEADQDVTAEILSNDKGVLLMIAYKLEKAKDLKVDEINGAFDHASDQGIAFYCVTASSEDKIREWTDKTGAEYPFLMGDETVLKTIIRSNPGFVLLKNGTIFAKWHYNDMPDESGIQKVLSDYLSKDTAESREEDKKIALSLFAFAVPLLLVWLYDYFRHRRRKEKKN